MTTRQQYGLARVFLDSILASMRGDGPTTEQLKTSVHPHDLFVGGLTATRSAFYRLLREEAGIPDATGDIIKMRLRAAVEVAPWTQDYLRDCELMVDTFVTAANVQGDFDIGSLEAMTRSDLVIMNVLTAILDALTLVYEDLTLEAAFNALRDEVVILRQRAPN